MYLEEKVERVEIALQYLTQRGNMDGVFDRDVLASINPFECLQLL